MMTREQAVSALDNGDHVYDDFGTRGRVTEAGDDWFVQVRWIGEDSSHLVHLDRINEGPNK